MMIDTIGLITFSLDLILCVIICLKNILTYVQSVILSLKLLGSNTKINTLHEESRDLCIEDAHQPSEEYQFNHQQVMNSLIWYHHLHESFVEWNDIEPFDPMRWDPMSDQGITDQESLDSLNHEFETSSASSYDVDPNNDDEVDIQGDEKLINRDLYYRRKLSDSKYKLDTATAAGRLKQAKKEEKAVREHKKKQFFVNLAINQGIYLNGKRRNKIEKQDDETSSSFDYISFFKMMYSSSTDRFKDLKLPSFGSTFSDMYDTSVRFYYDQIEKVMPWYARWYNAGRRYWNLNQDSYLNRYLNTRDYSLLMLKAVLDIHKKWFKIETNAALVEMYVGFYYLLKEQRTVKGVLLSFHSFLQRTIFPRGLSQQIYEIIMSKPDYTFEEPRFAGTHYPEEFLGNTVVYDSWEFDSVPIQNQGFPSMSWKNTYEYIRDCYFGMKSRASCELVSQIQEVLVTLIKFEFIKSVKCKEIIEEIKGIKISKLKISTSSAAVLLIDTVFMVVDKIWSAISEGNYKLLFSTTSATLKLEEDYADAMAAYRAYCEDKMEEMNLTTYDVEIKLDNVLVALSNQLKVCTGHDRNYFSIKYQKVYSTLADYQRELCSATIRERPFGLLLYGDTGVGKSSATSYLLKSLYSALGLKYTEESVVSLNAADKYQSEYKARHTAIVLDDIANTAPNFCSGTSPLQIIVDTINNQPKFALKPDVESKGKVAFRPKFVIGTTNAKNLMAPIYSTNPASILSRFEYIITVEVLPRFRMANSTRLDQAKVGTEMEFQRFEVQQCVQVENGSSEQFVPVYHNNKLMKGLALGELLMFLTEKAKIFSEQQRQLVTRTRKIVTDEMCEHSVFKNICLSCREPEPMEVEIEAEGDEVGLLDIGYTMMRIINRLPFAFIWHCVKLDRQLREYKTRGLVRFFFTHPHWFFVLLLSPVLFAHFYIANFYAYIGELVWILFCWFVYFTFTCMSKVVNYYTMVAADYRQLKRKINANVCKYMNYKWYIISGVVVLLYLNKDRICRWLGLASVDQGQTQSREDPRESVPQRPVYRRENVISHDRSENYVEYDNPHVSFAAPDSIYYESRTKGLEVPNMWKKPVVEAPLFNSKNMTFEEVENRTRRGIAMLKYYSADRQTMNTSNAFYIHHCCWLVPYHIVSRNYAEVDFIYSPLDRPGGNFRTKIGNSSYVRIGKSDNALLYLPQSTPRHNNLKLFLSKEPSSRFEGKMLYRNSDAEIMGEKSIFEAYKFTQTAGNIEYERNAPCRSYQWTYPTFKGLCGGIVIGNYRNPFVYGMHIAGKTGQKFAVAQFVTREQLEEAMKKFEQVPHYFDVCSQGQVALDVPDKKIFLRGEKEINRMSPTLFMENDAQLNYYGPHSGPGRTFRSGVKPTYISQAVEEVFGIVPTHGPPKNLNSWRPWQAELSLLTHLKSLNPDLLDIAIMDMRVANDEFCSTRKNVCSQMHKISNDVNLAGLDSISGFEAINLNASSGWPYCRPKSEFIVPSSRVVKGISRPLDAPDWLWSEVDAMEEVLLNEERVHLIHRCNLKDEPTKLTKEKVRVFAGTPVAGLLLVRRYYLPICKFIMDNPIHFECAVGVNCYSKQWTELTEAMMKYGENRMIAGDYKSFDSTMPSQLTTSAMNLLIDIAKKCDYSERDIKIMTGIATEICFPLYEFNGDFIQVNGSNPSGHSLTVFLNNIANSLYLRYAYFEIAMCNKISPPKFKDVVSVICYGDDNKMSVKDGYDWYNHTAISESLAKCDITYTMADKEAKSVPYINNSDCTFLKRKSVWDPNFKRYLCPIEIGTLNKMLHSYLDGGVMDPMEHSVNVIDNVLREAFFHGREVFEQYRVGLVEVVKRCEMQIWFGEKGIPSYLDYEKWYVESYIYPRSITIPPSCGDVKTTLGPQGLETTRRVYGYGDVLQQYMLQTLHSSLDGSLVNTPYLGLRPLLEREGGIIATLSFNKAISNKYNTENGLTNHQTVTFHDGTSQIVNTIDSSQDSTYWLSANSDRGLEKFFERPQLLATYSWAVTSSLGVTFNPWELFFTESSVRARMDNYHLLHCNLAVKFLITGNPFYYGRLMVDYVPLHNYDTITNYSTSDLLNVTAASQRMHLYLDPCTSQGGTMRLPYLLNSNAANIHLGDIINNGVLNIRTLQPLAHANDSVQPVTISVFIWAENVKMSIPTTRSAYEAQGDEYHLSNTQNIASTVAKVSGVLGEVPMIGPYAKATEMVATALGAVARLFGFSRPHVIEATQYVKPEYMSNLANTNVADNVSKLTFDVKQELTIDTRTMGLSGRDELSIKYIAGIESYLTQFVWKEGHGPGDVLFSSRLNPMISTESSGLLYLPACAFAALPFKYWRGSIKFRFDFVCSAYHRGRVVVVHDPAAINAYNTNLLETRVFDLNDSQDLTFVVGWTASQAFLKVGDVFSGLSYYETNTLSTNYPDYDNGTMEVRVLNELTTPSSSGTNDVYINVFVSMCDDVEFATPNEQNFATSYYEAQGDETMLVNTVLPTNEGEDDVLHHEIPVYDHTYDVFFGETFSSFRPLLRRYCLHSSWVDDTASNDTERYWFMTHMDFPLYRGIFSTGVHDYSTHKANSVFNTLLNYLAPAFLMYRGSIRNKYIILDTTTTVVKRAYIVRDVTPDVLYSSSSGTLTKTDIASHAELFIAYNNSCYNGAHCIASSQQPVIEIETPYYSNTRFSICKDLEVTGSNSDYRIDSRTHTLNLLVSSSNTPIVERWTSVGEDFTLGLFQGCPPFRYQSLI